MEREESIDPRVKRTRKLLQQALMELLGEKKFADMNIQDITTRATLNRATFYAHFPDKYALLESALHERYQQMLANRFPSTLKWKATNVRILIRATFDFLSEVQQLYKPFDSQIELLVGKIVQPEISRVLLEWLKQDHELKISPRIRLKTVTSVMSWVILGTAIEWAFLEVLDEETLSTEEITNQIFLVLSEGVAQLVPGLLS